MPSFNPTGTETNFGSTTSDTSTAGSLTGTGSDLGDAITGLGSPDTSGTLTDLSAQGAAVDPNIGTTDPSSGGSDAGNISSLLSSLGTSGLGNLALAGGAYGLLASQASAAQGQNNALAGQISAIGQPAVTAGQGLLSAFQGGTLTAPYASQYQNAVAQNQQAATSEQQQSGQLLANAGGGNVQGAQAGEYQQISNQQALANSNALTQSFMNELQASLGLTQEGGGFVQSGIQQEIQSNTQLQGQLSQLMAALAGAYVKSQGSGGAGGGGSNSISNLISGGKNAYSTASKLMNGSTTAADNAAASADAAEAASSQASVFAGSGIGDVSAASDTTSALADLSSSGADANLVGDISSFSSGADAAGAASTTAAAGADVGAGAATGADAAAGADVGASAGADAGAISAFGDVSAYAAPLAIAFGAYEQNLSEQIPSIDKTILSDTGQAQANIPAQYYQQAIMRGESPFQAWQAADPTAANADIQSLMAALQSPQNQQAAAQYGVSLPENFTGVNGVPNQLMEIYGGGPGGGSVVGDAQYHLT